MEPETNIELFRGISPYVAIILSVISTVATGLLMKFGEHLLERFKDRRKEIEEEKQKVNQLRLDDHIFLSSERDKAREDLIEDNERLRSDLKDRDNNYNELLKKYIDLQSDYRELLDKYQRLLINVDKLEVSEKSLKRKMVYLQENSNTTPPIAIQQKEDKTSKKTEL